MTTLETSLGGMPLKLKKQYGNYIAGEWMKPLSQSYFENTSPITGKVLCEIPRSNAADVDRALDAQQVALAECGVDVSAQFIRRPAGDEVGEAAGGVAAEQGALRTAQHLDPVDVEQGESESRHLADVHVIDVDGRRAFLVVGEVVLRDAANRETERGWAVRLGQDHGRHGLGDVRGGGGAQGIEVGTGDGRQRDADVLRVLLALLRGHHDFFKSAGRRGRLGVNRGAGKSKDCGKRIARCAGECAQWNPLKFIDSSHGHVSAVADAIDTVHAKSHARGAFP